ncbi:MAG: hypothetical protein GTN90_04720 [Xanthomonadales bacterium]|nr:hypothetical protein [Xanthomonadales bacterium]
MIQAAATGGLSLAGLIIAHSILATPMVLIAFAISAVVSHRRSATGLKETTS